ncbi:MAG: FG-GAP-like repeat-containing protein, partial [Candidatus Sabulitectum sp.]|nr:FG-GAP-like repeat-containing protein [Candidatus Sabulitectum sp.]
QAGFPFDTGGSCMEPSAQVVDIDNDGDMEILIATGSSLKAYHHDCTMVAGFPVTVGGYGTHTAAVADLDGDGDLEIVIAGQRSDLYVYRTDGTLEPGWPQNLDDDDGAAGSPALADLDNDGDLEIVIGTFKDLNGSSGYIFARMYVFHHDGTRYDGWPVYDVDSYAVSASPAIADIDNDGSLEIIVAGRDTQTVHAWNDDGTIVPGFPVSLSGLIDSSPTVADVDNDGDLEIFIATGSEKVYGLHHDGTFLAGWPQNMGGGSTERSSPSIGDIDGDGDLEIVCGSAHHNVYAWHHDGTIVTGWPQPTGTSGAFAQGTPALADVNGDGDIEIIASAYTGIFVWDDDGTLHTGYPVETGWTRSSPVITDLDLDGDVEIIVGSMNHNLYAWDLAGTLNPGNVEWGSFRHDLYNSGYYNWNSVGINDADEIVIVKTPFELSCSPNPVMNASTISYVLSANGCVHLDIYDISGRLVRILVDGEYLTPGEHSVLWDGRNSSGIKAAPGIYFCRLESGSNAGTLEMILLD